MSVPVREGKEPGPDERLLWVAQQACRIWSRVGRAYSRPATTRSRITLRSSFGHGCDDSEHRLAHRCRSV